MIYSVITGVVLALAACVYLLRMFRSVRDQQQVIANELGHLRNDLAALCKASAGAGNRVIGTEQKLRRLIERQDQLELRNGNQKSYSQAIQMAQSGVSAKELVLNCGITQGEADLLTMLHAVPKAG